MNINPQQIINRQSERIGQQITEILMRDAAIESLQAQVEALQAALEEAKSPQEDAA